MNNLPNNPEINVQNLKPFTKFCMTIGVLPSSYLKSLTYEEQLLWFCEFLEIQVIPTVNNNNSAVTELQNLYIELKNYVDNYFTNLDVQEEINNKIDSMVESGQFDTILQKYIQPYLNQFNSRLDEQDELISEKFNEQDDKINDINYKINTATTISPTVVSSIEDMTDTSKLYVNTNDGKWYYFNGSSWTIGGDYQSVQVADNSITLDKLSYQFKKDTNNYLDVSQILPETRFTN